MIIGNKYEIDCELIIIGEIR